MSADEALLLGVALGLVFAVLGGSIVMSALRLTFVRRAFLMERR